MLEFKVSEISAVDRPAQEHARALVMKRQDELASFATFSEAMAGIKKRDGLTGVEAMRRTREAYPELYRKLQSNPATSRPRRVEKQVSKGILDFRSLVDSIARDRSVPKTKATQVGTNGAPDGVRRVSTIMKSA